MNINYRRRTSVRAAFAAVALSAGTLTGVVGAATASAASTPKATALDGVSCVKSTFCVGVGITTSAAFASVWNGDRWTRASLPNLPSKGQLNSVSCTSMSFCMAVGVSFTSSAQKPLAYTFDGHRWARAAFAAAAANKGWMLRVSCTSSSFCFTTVNFQNGDDAVERWNGTQWRTSKSPLSQPDKISCVSTKACLAIDGYGDKSMRWNGTEWLAIKGTVAAGVPSNGGATMYGLDCTAPSACAAYGDSAAKGSERVTVEQWNGTSWRRTKVPHSAADNNEPIAVDCPTLPTCRSVGVALYASGYQTFTLVRHHSTWTANRGAASSKHTRHLTDVSCWAASGCLAVGGATDSTSQVGTPLAVRWNGTRWKNVSTP